MKSNFKHVTIEWCDGGGFVTLVLVLVARMPEIIFARVTGHQETGGAEGSLRTVCSLTKTSFAPEQVTWQTFRLASVTKTVLPSSKRSTSMARTGKVIERTKVVCRPASTLSVVDGEVVVVVVVVVVVFRTSGIRWLWQWSWPISTLTKLFAWSW